MKINIWSDVRCPFCYIGKRKFEKALEKFSHKDEVKVVWKSFQLDPKLQTQPNKNAYEHFAEHKGMSLKYAEQMHNRAAQIAKEVGLTFNFDKAVVANSFNAHRLIQFAKTKGLSNEAEEQLFKAYFTEGKNIDDIPTLIKTGVSIGLDEKELKEVFASDAFAKEVQHDELTALKIGVTGVPFFVFNDKYAVSGAQPVDTFLRTLEISWKEFEKENSSLIITEGQTCSVNGSCNE
jgi:predicted DsbA family dithiol-disulfide isomerase